jgi:hypothetical protein
MNPRKARRPIVPTTGNPTKYVAMHEGPNRSHTNTYPRMAPMTRAGKTGCGGVP